jgi:type I pantothenate kinase
MAELSDLVELLLKHRPARRPYVIAITGGVAVGKSVLTVELAKALGGWPGPPSVEIVCTDGFLFDNATLEARGLSLRKGFPETYDTKALRAALTAIRLGRATFPSYSHTIYDVDPALARTIVAPDVLIVEGLGLESDHGADAAGRPLINALIYLDAEPEHIEAWFTARILELMLAAKDDPSSFYARFLDMDEPARRAFARTVWERINLPNLTEHIVAAKGIADIVVTKQPDHMIAAIERRTPPR